MTRTVRGLPVIGGDIVVHQDPGGAFKGASQTLRAPLDLAVPVHPRRGRGNGPRPGPPVRGHPGHPASSASCGNAQSL